MANARRRAAVVAAALLVLAVLGVPGAAAQGAAGEVEVRVAAQRLADGRTEFALQERESDGSWAPRRLPSARFFPANADVGRWLSSSPLTVEAQPDSMLTATAEAGVEVRVAAQLLADGRMEFALQEREADGSWAELRLPSARFFPANAGVGRWLSSSALTVQVFEVAPAPTPTPAPAAPAAGTCVLAESAERVSAATFQVQTTTGTGTAFYIGKGEWITNHHVVDDVSNATLANGATRVTATIAGSLPDYDLALLRARPPGSVPALAFAGSRPELASDLMVVGFPVWVSSTPSVTRGAVSKHAPFSSHYPGRNGVVVQVDAAVNPGNSGGPIVDDCGTVIGVATFGYDVAPSGRPVEGISFGVAAETVAAQLPSLRSSTHYARRSASATVPATTTLEITAVCNDDWDSSEDCRAAAMRGLDNSTPEVWTRGVDDFDNVYYSIDGGEGRDYLSLRGLGRGRHTLRANELKAGGWTGWSPPHAFTITAAAPLEIRAVCNGAWADYDTSDACFAAGSGGILADSSPVIWTLGVAGWDNVRYSVDGGPASTFEDLNLRALAAGFHTIRASEQQAAGWTGWSEPYAFTITGAAPIEITAICNRNSHETSDECRAAGVSGILAARSPSIWRRGTVGVENVQYSVDGGPAVTWEDFTLRNLTRGRHHVRLSEQQPAGWTGWSEPHWFTITGAAPLEILAICNYGRYTAREDAVTSDDCRARAANGLDPGGGWQTWTRGVDDSNNLFYRIDGGAQVASADRTLEGLADGQHTIEAREQQTAGWTAWSAPYTFTIRDRPATLVIIAFCSGIGDVTFDDCHAAAGNIDGSEGLRWWIRGVDDYDDVRYRIDGGAAITQDRLNLRNLSTGRHTIAARELQAAGWTGWSAPYTFTIRR